MPKHKKINPPPGDMRADASLSLFHQIQIGTLFVDPFSDEPLACVLAPVLLNSATEAERAFVANLFAEALGTCTSEQLAAFFARVTKLALNAEQTHRIAAAYFGYSRFIEETGREPSKPELKAYLIARPETFKGMPRDESKSDWTDLWKACGLSNLANR
jgi:hypothetical protein